MSIYDIKLKDLPLCKRGNDNGLQNFWYVECDVCKTCYMYGEFPDAKLPEGWVHEPIDGHYYRAVCFDCSPPVMKEPDQE